MKGILKIIYIVVGVIATILVYVLGYNSNCVNHIVNLTNEAIAEKDYVQLAKIHGGCFDVNNLAVENDDKFDLVIFPGTTLSSYSYYKEEGKEDTIQANSYDKAYYIYVVNPTYNITPNELNGEYVNGTAIRFKSAEGSYDYLLEVTDTINSNNYSEKPYSVNDIILNGKRQSLTYNDNWGFINLTLSQTIVTNIQSSLKGDINAIELLDRDGQVVFSQNIALDFKTQKFFDDVNPLCVKYNEYIQTIDAAKDDATKKLAEENFQSFYKGTEDTKGFEETFLENTNYSFRLADSTLQPSSLIWSTIGIVVLFFIVLVLLYFLLFHFAFIKRLVSRENRNKAYRVNPGANRRTVIDAKVEDVKKEEPENK